MTLDEYMAWPWTFCLWGMSDGDFSLTVPGLDDFEMFAPTMEELVEERFDALRSHLAAYIATGKSIPYPPKLKWLENVL